MSILKSVKIQENIPLKNLTAFRIGGPARYFVKIENLEDIKDAFSFAEKNNLKVFVLGSGSNLLISDAGFDGLVISPDMRGIEKIEENARENKDEVKLKVGSGEDWDTVVAYAVDAGFWGMENLSYIPGKVGGVPMQNVGAYGQEAANIVESVEVYDITEKKVKIIKNAECEFGYRESRFNKREKGKCIILSVLFKLKKTSVPNMKYLDVENYFKEKNIAQPSLKEMREAIVWIRKNKLPDPAKIGNAGSFFKNLILNEKELKELFKNIRKNTNEETVNKLIDIRNRLFSPSGVKIPTAFLVDVVCGLKGFKMGGVKVHDRQPLVLVNESGEATAKEVLNLARYVMQEVYKKTGIKIYPEPELVGFTEEEVQRYLLIDPNNKN